MANGNGGMLSTEIRTFWALVMYCIMKLLQAKYVPNLDPYVDYVIIAYMGKQGFQNVAKTVAESRVEMTKVKAGVDPGNCPGEPPPTP